MAGSQQHPYTNSHHGSGMGSFPASNSTRRPSGPTSGPGVAPGMLRRSRHSMLRFRRPCNRYMHNVFEYCGRLLSRPRSIRWMVFILGVVFLWGMDRHYQRVGNLHRELVAVQGPDSPAARNVNPKNYIGPDLMAKHQYLLVTIAFSL